jgi:hypothetical protein
VKVYLVRTSDGKQLFYAERPDESAHPHPTHGGVRGWLERKAAALRTAWEHSEGWLANAFRRIWHWLQKFIPVDEAMIVRMRSAPAIEVHHPTSVSEEEVRALWQTYLAGRQRWHFPWLVIDALISPMTIVLAPLPGPNVVGYWFGYRAIRHLLAVLGLRRARSGRVVTTFHPHGPLDHPIGDDAHAWTRRTDLDVDADELKAFLERGSMHPVEAGPEVRA